MELKYISPYEIKSNEINARRHDLTTMPLCHSIKEFGFLNPILIDMNNVVICGEARLKAARDMGMLEVPVLQVDLTPEQAKQYYILDNSIQERTGWNYTKKRELVNELNIPKGAYGLSDEIREMEEIDGLFTVDDTISLFEI